MKARTREEGGGRDNNSDHGILSRKSLTIKTVEPESKSDDVKLFPNIEQIQINKTPTAPTIAAT